MKHIEVTSRKCLTEFTPSQEFIKLLRIVTSTQKLLVMTSTVSQVSADSISSCLNSFAAAFFQCKQRVSRCCTAMPEALKKDSRMGGKNSVLHPISALFTTYRSMVQCDVIRNTEPP
jgi:hypothetical protein